MKFKIFFINVAVAFSILLIVVHFDSNSKEEACSSKIKIEKIFIIIAQLFIIMKERN